MIIRLIQDCGKTLGRIFRLVYGSDIGSGKLLVKLCLGEGLGVVKILRETFAGLEERFMNSTSLPMVSFSHAPVFRKLLLPANRHGKRLGGIKRSRAGEGVGATRYSCH